jgi:hypothetical protein
MAKTISGLKLFSTGIPQFMSLIHSSKTARKAKTRKTKINFPLLPKKRRWEQQLVCERKELEKRELACKLKNRY